MLGLVHVAHRHLVGAPVALALLAVDLLRAGPALGRAQHDHRPARPLRDAVRARASRLDPLDLGDDRVERRGHLLVHRRRARRPRRSTARSRSPRSSFSSSSSRDAREEAGVGDLVAVQVQDRQHRAVARRVEELVRVPAGGERAGLGLAVADDAGDDQVGVVERGAVGVRQRVAELAALVDRARASPARRGSGCRRGRRTA